MNALESVSDVFNTFGGHAAAAGFSLDVSRLEEATERLQAYAGTILTPEDLLPTLYADVEIEREELSGKAIMDLERLQPFGTANLEPSVVLRKSVFKSITPTRNPAHLQFVIGAAHDVRGIAFSQSESFEKLKPDSAVDMFLLPRMETYNGNRYAKVELVSMEWPK